MRSIIFDCDGVLVDSESLLITNELRFLAKHGVTFDFAQYSRRFLGVSLADWEVAVAQIIVNAGGVAPERSEFEALAASTDAKLRAALQPISGAAEFLASNVLPRAVASSSTPEQLQWKLANTGLRGHFGAHVYSSKLVKQGKPEPDLFLYVASQLQAQASQCVVIEDSAGGVRAAKAANMMAVGFVGGSHCLPEHGESLSEAGADTVVSGFSDLTQWLDTTGDVGR